MNTLGKQGEDLALQYVLSKGYIPISRNFSSKYGEIDIIALYKNQLICIEVKTRSSALNGFPEDCISPLKLVRILQTTRKFIATHAVSFQEIRCDVISVIIQNQKHRIQHFKNVCLYDTI